jgi:hypothetical protein
VCLSKTYRKVCIDKNLSDMFPIQNGRKQGDALSPLLFKSALENDIRKVQKIEIEWDTSASYATLICWKTIHS